MVAVLFDRASWCSCPQNVPFLARQSNAVLLSDAAGGEDDETSSSAPDVPRSSKIGPAAQLLLQGAGLSAEDVTPSGPGGIVTKGDVMQAIAGAAAHADSLRALYLLCYVEVPAHASCHV